METDAGGRKGRATGVRKGGDPAPEVVEEKPRKCTVMLPAEIDLRLTVYAKLTGKDRSTVIVDLLRTLLDGIEITFPGGRGG